MMMFRRVRYTATKPTKIKGEKYVPKGGADNARQKKGEKERKGRSNQVKT